MSAGTDKIQSLKRRMARILPMQLKGEFGLRAGEIRWISGENAQLWIPEKLVVGQVYEVRIDLRDQGRTVDGEVVVSEVHSTRKLRLRPGYLVVATYKLADRAQQGHLDDLLLRLSQGTASRSGVTGSGTAQSGMDSVSQSSSLVSGDSREGPGRGGQDSPSSVGLEGESISKSNSVSRDSTADSSASSSYRRTGGRVRRDAREFEPLGPAPSRPGVGREKREKPGQHPLGPPPSRKERSSDPVPVSAMFSAGPPPSIFVVLENHRQARGALQGEPPELQLWVTPTEELPVGLRPTVAFQLPGGRFVQLEGVVNSRDADKVLLSFPGAQTEDLHVLVLARQR